MKVRIGIVGATGYTGIELLRLLLRHPGIEVSAITSQKYGGMQIGTVFPSLAKITGLYCEEFVAERIVEKTDLVFTAVPHKTAMDTVPPLLLSGKRVIDLSADFRFNDPATYEKWYDKHTHPELLSKTVFGLPELHRSEIREAALVGNPGCYPTGALIGLIPLVKEGLISTDVIIVDSKSGVSGAGRDVVLESLYCEANEDVRAYKIFEHRHIPEIEVELSLLAGKRIEVNFVPHLVPMDRGILSTIYVRLLYKMKTEDLLEVFENHYTNEPFVRVYPKGMLPSTKDVRGSNYCDVGLAVNDAGERAVIVTAIDNLVKGASGQAVQNMNIMLGFPETTCLDVVPLVP